MYVKIQVLRNGTRWSLFKCSLALAINPLIDSFGADQHIMSLHIT